MPGTYISPAETGLYYLQSRYYNPELGRFINADAFTSTGQGFVGNNMFAYCNNNPVSCCDFTGELAISVAFGAYATSEIVTAIAGVIAALIINDIIVNTSTTSAPAYFPQIETTVIQEQATTAKEKVLSQEKAISEIVAVNEVLALTKKKSDYHLHHIVAKADYRATESRQILMDVGIDPLTDPRNHVLLPKNYHASLHTTAYHNYVTEKLRPAAGKKASVESALALLRLEILARSALGVRWD